MSDAEAVIDLSQTNIKLNETPYIEIIEQPQNITKFQNINENRWVETIKGVNSTQDEETYPTIELLRHKGTAVVVVSCVTKDPPHFPHPCAIIDKTGINKDGVYRLRFFSAHPQVLSFPDLIIERVSKNNVFTALAKRRRIQVDPFKTGFRHRHFPDSIDLNCVRLCFQTFLQDKTDSSYTIPLKPVVSEPIYNDASSAMEIYYISHVTASVAGGQAMCILSRKLKSGDVKVRFFNCSGWEAYARTVPPHFHRRIAVIFESPKYVSQDIDKPVSAYVELIRPSDGKRSMAVSFEFLPLEEWDRESLKRKRQKFRESPQDLVLRHLQAESVPGMDKYRMEEVQKIKEMQFHNIQRQQYCDPRYQHNESYGYQWNEQIAEQRIQQFQYNLLHLKTKEEEEYRQAVEKRLQEHLRQQEKYRYYTGQWVLQQQQLRQSEQAQQQQQQQNANEVEQPPQ